MPTMTIAEQTSYAKHHARELGFSLVGIAQAMPLQDAFAHYQEWLKMDFHGGANSAMQYMERNLDKREDVKVILPSAESVIVVAQNYFTPFQHEQTLSDAGKISRYAWGTDYHEVIPPKLRALCQSLANLDAQAEFKIYTDTGAILEKAWAVRAGIGWQGKHSNIISRQIGSWFFLGVIITSMKFLYDTPIKDYCGSCTACMTSCPTQAIIEPLVVDARKCISYWTIETKPQFDIPDDIASNMDHWLFGCDTCQDVCPWNRFQTPTDEQEFLPRNHETTISFKRIEEFQQENFSARFRKSPIKRTKLAGLQRNMRVLQQASKIDSSTNNV
jgi:epoxyqueuosine reductase